MDYIPNNFKSLSELFDITLSDLKGGIPLWDDLVIKITRLHASLRGVVQANSSFLESFQRIADLATNSSGLISKDIGTSLTRLSLRQRSLHSKMKAMNENIGCKIIDPMQQRLDEWKKNNLQLDKDRIKETRRAKSDLKKATEEKNRLQRKAIKRGSMKGLGPLQMQVEVALKEAADKYQSLENIEYDFVRRVLIEERSRFCYFISCLMPVLDCQLNMFSEMGTLQELKDQLTILTDNPHSLTHGAEQLIKSIMKPLSLSSVDTMLAATMCYSSTPPTSADAGSSEGSLVSSRKSSVLSINSEASSSHSGGVNNIPGSRRSQSSSPTNNILVEQEADDIFVSDGKLDKVEFESAHYSLLDPPDPGVSSYVSNDVSYIREYDSVTLKRPKQTGKCLPCEDGLQMLDNLPWQPDTPNMNANYTALYQLHQPIQAQQQPVGRKNSAGAINGNIYPDYHTIQSGSPTSKPRRMTVPELPVSMQTYATIRHQNRINVMHPPTVHLHQIDECHLPPTPGEDDSFLLEDLPMPPPPSMDPYDSTPTQKAPCLVPLAPQKASIPVPPAPPAPPAPQKASIPDPPAPQKASIPVPPAPPAPQKTSIPVPPAPPAPQKANCLLPHAQSQKAASQVPPAPPCPPQCGPPNPAASVPPPPPPPPPPAPPIFTMKRATNR